MFTSAIESNAPTKAAAAIPSQPRPSAVAPAVGGLLHLVEAATALSQLGEMASTPQTQTAQTSSTSNASTTHLVSDEDTTLASSSSSAPASPPRSASSKKSLKSSGGKKKASPAKKSHKVKSKKNTTKPKKTKKTKKASTGQTPREAFPRRLMRMLSDPTVTPIITWLPHGMSFVILRPDVFAERVLPLYFPESATDGRTRRAPTNSGTSPYAAKYPSFTRKLNRWGFRQIARGPDAGAFHHSLFRRDMPDLCDGLKCAKSRKSPSSSSGASTSSKAAPVAPPPSPKRPPQVTVTTTAAVDDDKDDASITSNDDSPGASPPSSPLPYSSSGGHSLPPKKRKINHHCQQVVVSDTPAGFNSSNASGSSNLIPRKVSNSTEGDDVSAITSASSVSSLSELQLSLSQAAGSNPTVPNAILDALMANRLRAERERQLAQQKQQQQQQAQAQVQSQQVKSQPRTTSTRPATHRYEPNLYPRVQPGLVAIAPRPPTVAAPSTSQDVLLPAIKMPVAQVPQQLQQQQQLAPAPAPQVNISPAAKFAEDARTLLYKAYMEALRQAE